MQYKCLSIRIQMLCSAVWREVWDRCDLLSGLRVCWHGMTDADYHSGESQLLWSSRHPRGLSWWNEMRYRTLCAAFCISSMLILSVWVLIVQSMGHSHASQALYGSDELLLHKAGRSCLLEKRMNYSLLCLSSLSIQDKTLFILDPS